MLGSQQNSNPAPPGCNGRVGGPPRPRAVGHCPSWAAPGQGPLSGARYGPPQGHRVPWSTPMALVCPPQPTPPLKSRRGRRGAPPPPAVPHEDWQGRGSGSPSPARGCCRRRQLSIYTFSAIGRKFWWGGQSQFKVKYFVQF